MRPMKATLSRWARAYMQAIKCARMQHNGDSGEREEETTTMTVKRSGSTQNGVHHGRPVSRGHTLGRTRNFPPSKAELVSINQHLLVFRHQIGNGTISQHNKQDPQNLCKLNFVSNEREHAFKKIIARSHFAAKKIKRANCVSPCPERTLVFCKMFGRTFACRLSYAN